MFQNILALHLILKLVKSTKFYAPTSKTCFKKLSKLIFANGALQKRIIYIKIAVFNLDQ